MSYKQIKQKKGLKIIIKKDAMVLPLYPPPPKKKERKKKKKKEKKATKTTTKKKPPKQKLIPFLISVSIDLVNKIGRTYRTLEK